MVKYEKCRQFVGERNSLLQELLVKEVEYKIIEATLEGKMSVQVKLGAKYAVLLNPDLMLKWHFADSSLSYSVVYNEDTNKVRIGW